MSQQVYFAVEGILIQFCNIGYLMYFTKNLWLKIKHVYQFQVILRFNLSITSILLSNVQF